MHRLLKLADKTIIVASHNVGKVREINELIAPFGFDAKSASVNFWVCSMISPVRLLSGASACITPGLAVDICTFEFWVMMAAIIFPPSAGRVCLKTPISS